ncbi:MAG: ATP-binding cassette domain-containing protein [Gemmatimonadota bacterium]|nr:ATP-binding cassette domain-containing protein [Gemmatimonadota bacterium]MDH5758924.1 ATP-binding cassette domain-containing protein [Gemmatimonadota bacterium]
MTVSADPATLEVRGLCKRFDSRQVLDTVDLDFQPGCITALLGPNGAGKTTLLKCVLGLVRPDEGTIRLGAQEVNGQGAYREEIGYMPQLPRLPGNLTGWEMASMLDDLRTFTGTPDEDLIDSLEVREEMDKPFRLLSGGTRQKVNAALAFRYGAPVMILDEPTAGLDPLAAMTLKEKVRAERERGRTILVTSHNLGELESLADQVVFLLEGRVRFAGTLDSLWADTSQTTLEGAIAELMRRNGRREAGAESRTGTVEGTPSMEVA